MARQQYRILFTDDDEKLTTAYARQLRAANYHVDVVHDLGEGLRHLNERSYDIALVDMNLSGIENDHSGGEGMLECLKTLREPIGAVVLTSEEDPQFVADLVQDWGVSRFVSKGTITKQGIAPLLSAIELALASTARARNARPDIIRLMAGGGDQEQLWVHTALQTLSPDGAYQGLASFLNELLRAFMPVFPAVSVRSSPLSRSADGLSLTGCFWSKGAGRAVLVGVQSSELDQVAAPVTLLPWNAVLDDVLGRHTSASVTGVVWGLLGCRRDQFT